MSSDYSIRIVDRPVGGVVVPRAELAVGGRTPLEAARVDSATRENNQKGEMVWSFPTRHPVMRQFRGTLNGREVQLWRRNRCVWWGVITAHRAGTDVVTVQAKGHLWYFEGLNFGPITTNYLTNPNFSTGDLSGWGASGVAASFDPSRVIRTTPGGVPGTARLVQANANTDTFLQQIVGPFVIDPAQGLFFTVAGWYMLDPTVTYDGPAYLERGLFIGRLDTSFHPVISAWSRINNRKPAWGAWQRLTSGITLPAGVTEYLDVRCYAPGAATNWGGLSLTVQESVVTGLAGSTTDVTNILAAIVFYAQDPGRQKVDYGIIFGRPDGSPNPPTGVVLDRVYQFYDLAGVFDAMNEFPSMGICDVSVEWDAANPTGRYFCVWPGGRGVAHPEWAVELVLDPLGHVRARLLSAVTVDADIERSADDVVWLGKGSSGSDREFGRARSDLSGLGGVLRQKITTAPADAALDTLDTRAGADLAVLSGQVEIPSFTVPGYLADTLLPGDTIPARIDYGFLHDSSTRRIVRTTLDPKTDTLAVEVN